MSLQTTVTTSSDGRAPAFQPTHELVDFDRYVVSHNGPVGYIEVVRPVFVCYVGHPFPRAEEVAQVHDFHDAVQVVSERAAALQRHEFAR